MNAMPVVPDATPSPPPQAGRDEGLAALDDCHRHMLAAVGALEDLVDAVERGAPTPALRGSAAAIADFFSTTARQHHEDEERHVFPALLASSDASSRQAALCLQRDHDALEEGWMELEPHVQAIATGFGAYELETLRLGVAMLASTYRDHIALEESIFTAAARSRLDEDARRRASGPARRRAPESRR